MKGASRLILIRHGESTWNAEGRLQGHGGEGLSERGRHQADAVAAALPSLVSDVGMVARSDSERVVETAAPSERVLRGPVAVDQRLREIDVGWWTGLTREEAADRDPDTMQRWVAGEDVPRGDGETFAELRARVWAALGDVAARADDGCSALVFTHGGPVRVAVAAALQLPPGGERRLESVANASMTVLRRRGGDRPTWTLAGYNATGHLR